LCPFRPRRAASSRRAKSLGLTIQAVAAAPQGARLAIGKPRVALVDLYGGLHPTGWLRWIFDGQELPYAIVYPQELDKGGLAKKYDILVVPDAAIRMRARAWTGHVPWPLRQRSARPRGCAREIPRLARRYQHGKTIPALKAFADAGGTLLAMGSSSSGLAAALRLPVTDPLLRERDGKRVPLSDTRFYVPGAVLTADVNAADPIAWGSAPR
jgi:hypothetical protein